MFLIGVVWRYKHQGSRHALNGVGYDQVVSVWAVFTDICASLRWFFRFRQKEYVLYFKIYIAFLPLY